MQPAAEGKFKFARKMTPFAKWGAYVGRVCVCFMVVYAQMSLEMRNRRVCETENRES